MSTATAIYILYTIYLYNIYIYSYICFVPSFRSGDALAEASAAQLPKAAKEAWRGSRSVPLKGVPLKRVL